MKLHESAENYLETIFMLEQESDHVRAIDIATALGFSKPSVSRAMKLLRENGYITIYENSHIALSPSGRAIAEEMYKRHTALSHFLIRLGVSESTAKEDACRMEHAMSQETFDKLFEFLAREYGTPHTSE